MRNLIKNLCELWGPSGYEHHVRQFIQAEVAPFVDEMRVDGLGNLICRVGSGGKRVLFGAHMDEIGAMITFVEPSSQMGRIAEIGGVFKNILPGTRVQFEDGAFGVVWAHAAKQGEHTIDEFYVDGLGKPLTPGTPVTFWRDAIIQNDYITAKALDDRVGCAVLIEALKRLNKQTANEVYAVFTVQEEVGLRGAAAAAYGVDPEVAVAIDVTDTGDLPRNARMAVKLGGGAAIKVHDPGLVVPRAVIDWMKAHAEAGGIPHQLELLTGGTTDAARFQISRAGVPSGCVSIPCRYIHTPSETVQLADVEAAANLIASLAREALVLA
jgi:endoglucanase